MFVPIRNARCNGKPNYRAEQEAAERERQEEWKRQQEQRQKNRANNRLLLGAVLDSIPKALTRDDYEALVFATIDRLQYDDWDTICEHLQHQHGRDAGGGCLCFRTAETGTGSKRTAVDSHADGVGASAVRLFRRTAGTHRSAGKRRPTLWHIAEAKEEHEG